MDESGCAQAISEPHWKTHQHCEKTPSRNLLILDSRRPLQPTTADTSVPHSVSEIFPQILPEPIILSARITHPNILLLTTEMSAPVKTGKKTRSAIADVVTREYTINMHKRVR